MKSGTIKYVLTLGSRKRQLITTKLKDLLEKLGLLEAWNLDNFDELDAACEEIERIVASTTNPTALGVALSAKSVEVQSIVQRVREERDANAPGDLKRQDKKLTDDLKAKEKKNQDDTDEDKDDGANHSNPGGAS